MSPLNSLRGRKKEEEGRPWNHGSDAKAGLSFTYHYIIVLLYM